jgi:putative hydroxymethylpyrimidine transport system substrate-binding protein
MMILSRRRALTAAPAAALLAGANLKPSYAASGEKFTVLLDWFVNPDHAPLFVAKYIGAYERAGLNVQLTAPTDPDLPPRLLAAGQVDAVLSYQTEIYLLVDQGLPVIRTGTLIDHTLDTLTALGSSGIKSLADFKGKKIGYSIAGTDQALLSAMLNSAGVTLDDVTLVNVNFDVVTALMSHEVAGGIGVYRTYEDIQLRNAGLNPVAFFPEQHGVPMSDELIIMSNATKLNNPALPRFLSAVKEGAAYLAANYEEAWGQFIKDQPTLNNKLNKQSWEAIKPYFAVDPFAFNKQQYVDYRDFMLKAGLIKHAKPIENYVVQIKA